MDTRGLGDSTLVETTEFGGKNAQMPVRCNPHGNVVPELTRLLCSVSAMYSRVTALNDVPILAIVFTAHWNQAIPAAVTGLAWFHCWSGMI